MCAYVLFLFNDVLYFTFDQSSNGKDLALRVAFKKQRVSKEVNLSNLDIFQSIFIAKLVCEKKCVLCFICG